MVPNFRAESAQSLRVRSLTPTPLPRPLSFMRVVGPPSPDLRNVTPIEQPALSAGRGAQHTLLPNWNYFPAHSSCLLLLQPWATSRATRLQTDTQTLSQVCGQRRPDVRAQMHRHTCALARRRGGELTGPGEDRARPYVGRGEIGLCVCPGGRFLGRFCD
jgi:hypothetical protein